MIVFLTKQRPVLIKLLFQLDVYFLYLEPIPLLLISFKCRLWTHNFKLTFDSLLEWPPHSMNNVKRPNYIFYVGVVSRFDTWVFCGKDLIIVDDAVQLTTIFKKLKQFSTFLRKFKIVAIFFVRFEIYNFHFPTKISETKKKERGKWERERDWHESRQKERENYGDTDV